MWLKRVFCVFINFVGFCVWKMHDIRAMKTNLDPSQMFQNLWFVKVVLVLYSPLLICFAVVNTFSERLSAFLLFWRLYTYNWTPLRPRNLWLSAVSNNNKADARTSEVRGTPVVPFNISLEIMYICILFFLRDLTTISARSVCVTRCRKE